MAGPDNKKFARLAAKYGKEGGEKSGSGEATATVEVSTDGDTQVIG